MGSAPDPVTATVETTPSTASAAGAGAVLAAAEGSLTEPAPGADSLAIGALVSRYQVRRLLARGGMGQVYLARDTTLGRSVALKLVRADRIDDADGFIREAQITAQLNHPHIVQLHDVGRFGAHAFLALEYLEGESLRDRMRREDLSRDESLRILRAIADALCHAHAANVFHCDLKPGNVMIPLDGRVRVVDFGLATIRAPIAAGAGPAGTPDWMAPEQWRGDALSDRTDVWALAVIAHQLIARAHPFERADSVDQRRRRVLDETWTPPALPAESVSDELQTLALRSLSRDPLARPTASDWHRALDAVLDPSGTATSVEGPFRGLAAFDERHAAVFFGRESEIDACLERMRELPAVPIVGPSGVGKSSFLLAGVIPRLRARGGWTIITVRPGTDPFVAVAHRLLAAVDEHHSAEATSELAAMLKETPSLLAIRLATIAKARGGHVLLAIDQLEEAFTQGASARDIEQFVALLAAVDDAAEPIRLVYTLREDFLGRIPDIRDLFVLRGLDGAALRRTITAPLARLGYSFDRPELVDEMLAEATGGAVDLALLQFACRTLWESRDPQRRLLLESAYRAHGGVAGALARHADDVLSAMTADEQAITRQILGRLVVGTSARRIVERDRLLEDLPEFAVRVLDRLLAARLLVQQRGVGTEVISIELAHESLLVNWQQLRLWLDESGEERRFLNELDEAASFWERRGARAEETWAEAETAAARLHASKLRLSLPSRAERFLAAAESQHRGIRGRARVRRAVLVGAAVLVTLVALFLANRFRDQKLEAEAQASALRLAGGNKGRVEILLRPFDWKDGASVPIDANTLPSLSIALYAPQPGLDLPGDPIASELVEITSNGGGRFVIDAPGGPTFLRIDGRGRAGEQCAASWIRLLALPGYAERAASRRIELNVPTCAATAAGMIDIPAGPFIYGGPGVPPTTIAAEHILQRETLSLDRYAIDRTEATNAQFAPFAELSSVSGYPVPVFPMEGLLSDVHKPDMPVSSIDAFEAAAFCRFWGKRLPTEQEWTKAARGGAEIDGKPNSSPERLRPFLGDVRSCLNTDGDADGFKWSNPVGAIPCGASPYGVLDMAGNLSEWMARHDQSAADMPLRVVRGGDVSAPAELEHHTTVFRNARDPRQFDFAQGVRCVADGNHKRGSTWRTH